MKTPTRERFLVGFERPTWRPQPRPQLHKFSEFGSWGFRVLESSWGLGWIINLKMVPTNIQTRNIRNSTLTAWVSWILHLRECPIFDFWWEKMLPRVGRLPSEFSGSTYFKYLLRLPQMATSRYLCCAMVMGAVRGAHQSDQTSQLLVMRHHAIARLVMT